MSFLRIKKRRTQPPHSTLEPQAIECLKDGPILVAELYNQLKKENSALDPADVTELVWDLTKQGKIELANIPAGDISILKYLGTWEENLWFYLALAASILAALSVSFIPSNSSLVALRWVLGSALAIFLPGYVMVKGLFPDDTDLGTGIRVALSVGFSLVSTMLMGLVLIYSHWGIRPNPILLSMTILTIGLTFLALRERFTRARYRRSSGASGSRI